MAVRYVRSPGAGTQDGSTWGNAAPISDLDNQVSLAGAGGEVWLRAGDHFSAVSPGPLVQINHGGTFGAPVRIRGVSKDGRPGWTFIDGDRQTPFDSTTAFTNTGGAGIQFNDGSSNIVVDHLWFRNMGDACLQTPFGLTAQLSNVDFFNIRGENVRKFINIKTGKGIINSVWRGLVVKGASGSIIRLGTSPTTGVGSSSANIVIQDFDFDCDFQYEQNGGGIALSGTNDGIVIKRGKIRHSWYDIPQTSSDTSYWNLSDGISIEGVNTNILVEDVEIEGVDDRVSSSLIYDTTWDATDDGGIDCKCTTAVLRRVKVSGCKRNFRLWYAGIIAEDCESYSPRRHGEGKETGAGRTCLWSNDGGVRWIGGVIDAQGDVGITAVQNDGATPIYIEDAIVRQPTGATFVTGSGTVTERNVRHEVVN